MTGGDGVNNRLREGALLDDTDGGALLPAAVGDAVAASPLAEGECAVLALASSVVALVAVT